MNSPCHLFCDPPSNIASKKIPLLLVETSRHDAGAKGPSLRQEHAARFTNDLAHDVCYERFDRLPE